MIELTLEMPIAEIAADPIVCVRDGKWLLKSGYEICQAPVLKIEIKTASGE